MSLELNLKQQNEYNDLQNQTTLSGQDSSSQSELGKSRSSFRITLIVVGILGSGSLLVGVLGVTNVIPLPTAAWASLTASGGLTVTVVLILVAREIANRKTDQIEDVEYTPISESVLNEVFSSEEEESISSEMPFTQVQEEIQSTLNGDTSTNRLPALISHVTEHGTEEQIEQLGRTLYESQERGNILVNFACKENPSTNALLQRGEPLSFTGKLSRFEVMVEECSINDSSTIADALSDLVKLAEESMESRIERLQAYWAEHQESPALQQAVKELPQEQKKYFPEFRPSSVVSTSLEEEPTQPSVPRNTNETPSALKQPLPLREQIEELTPTELHREMKALCEKGENRRTSNQNDLTAYLLQASKGNRNEKAKLIKYCLDQEAADNVSMQKALSSLSQNRSFTASLDKARMGRLNQQLKEATEEFIVYGAPHHGVCSGIAKTAKSIQKALAPIIKLQRNIHSELIKKFIESSIDRFLRLGLVSSNMLVFQEVMKQQFPRKKIEPTCQERIAALHCIEKQILEKRKLRALPYQRILKACWDATKSAEEKKQVAKLYLNQALRESEFRLPKAIEIEILEAGWKSVAGDCFRLLNEDFPAKRIFRNTQDFEKRLLSLFDLHDRAPQVFDREKQTIEFFLVTYCKVGLGGPNKAAFKSAISKLDQKYQEKIQPSFAGALEELEQLKDGNLQQSTLKLKLGEALKNAWRLAKTPQQKEAVGKFFCLHYFKGGSATLHTLMNDVFAKNEQKLTSKFIKVGIQAAFRARRIDIIQYFPNVEGLLEHSRKPAPYFIACFDIIEKGESLLKKEGVEWVFGHVRKLLQGQKQYYSYEDAIKELSPSIQKRIHSSSVTPQTSKIQTRTFDALSKETGLPIEFLSALHDSEIGSLVDIARGLFMHRELGFRVTQAMRNRIAEIEENEQRALETYKNNYTLIRTLPGLKKYEELSQRWVKLFREVKDRQILLRMFNALTSLQKPQGRNSQGNVKEFEGTYAFLRTVVGTEYLRREIAENETYGIQAMQLETLAARCGIATCSQGQNRSANIYALLKLLNPKMTLVYGTHGGQNGLDPQSYRGFYKEEESKWESYKADMVYGSFWRKVREEFYSLEPHRLGHDVQFILTFGEAKPPLFLSEEFKKFAKEKGWTKEVIERFAGNCHSPEARAAHKEVTNWYGNQLANICKENKHVSFIEASSTVRIKENIDFYKKQGKAVHKARVLPCHVSDCIGRMPKSLNFEQMYYQLLDDLLKSLLFSGTEEAPIKFNQSSSEPAPPRRGFDNQEIKTGRARRIQQSEKKNQIPGDFKNALLSFESLIQSGDFGFTDFKVWVQGVFSRARSDLQKIEFAECYLYLVRANLNSSSDFHNRLSKEAPNLANRIGSSSFHGWLSTIRKEHIQNPRSKGKDGTLVSKLDTLHQFIQTVRGDRDKRLYIAWLKGCVSEGVSSNRRSTREVFIEAQQVLPKQMQTVPSKTQQNERKHPISLSKEFDSMFSKFQKTIEGGDFGFSGFQSLLQRTFEKAQSDLEKMRLADYYFSCVESDLNSFKECHGSLPKQLLHIPKALELCTFKARVEAVRQQYIVNRKGKGTAETLQSELKLFRQYIGMVKSTRHRKYCRRMFNKLVSEGKSSSRSSTRELFLKAQGKQVLAISKMKTQASSRLPKNASSAQFEQAYGLPVAFIRKIRNLGVSREDLVLIGEHRLLKEQIVSDLKRKVHECADYADKKLQNQQNNTNFKLGSDPREKYANTRDLFESTKGVKELEKKTELIISLFDRFSTNQLRELNQLLFDGEDRTASTEHKHDIFGHCEQSIRSDFKKTYSFLRNVVELAIIRKEIPKVAENRHVELMSLFGYGLIATCSQGQNRSAMLHGIWRLLFPEAKVINGAHGGDNGLDPRTYSQATTGVKPSEMETVFDLAYPLERFWDKASTELFQLDTHRAHLDVEFVNHFGFIKPPLLFSKEFAEFAKKKGWGKKEMENFQHMANGLDRCSSVQQALQHPDYQKLKKLQDEITTWYFQQLKNYSRDKESGNHNRLFFGVVADQNLLPVTMKQHEKDYPQHFDPDGKTGLKTPTVLVHGIGDCLGKDRGRSNLTENYEKMREDLLNKFIYNGQQVSIPLFPNE